jgi:hypothetical protein
MILGAHNYFRQIETENAGTQKNLADFILGCQSAVGIVAEPEFSGEDERLDIVFEIAERLDGVIFNGADMIDKKGRLILGGDGESETSL